jgi:hypothetical protein
MRNSLIQRRVGRNAEVVTSTTRAETLWTIFL